MLVGRVTGCVVSTVKDEGLRNIPLLTVAQVQERGPGEGRPLWRRTPPARPARGTLSISSTGRRPPRSSAGGSWRRTLSVVGFIDSYNRLLENEDKGERQ